MNFRHALLAAAIWTLSASCALAGATQGRPNEQCPRFAPHGYPAPPNAQVGARSYHICHANYSSYVDPVTRGPLWAAEMLVAEGLEEDEPRTNDFRPDPSIPAAAQARSQRADFSRSGYDQGHLAPAGDFRSSPQAMSESFLYSNIIPQDADNNRNAWRNLEIFTRQWAANRGAVHVVTGPIFSQGRTLGILGASKLAIPTHLFKVVFDYQRKESIAFVVPNAPIAPVGGKGTLKAWELTLSSHQVPVRDVEAWSGLRFNPAMPAASRDLLHAQTGRMWSARRTRAAR